ncbi:hypothetical protein M2H05_09525 [Vibrio vulnificus]|nr:hypothetical protein [Vibrio vulnificus]
MLSTTNEAVSKVVKLATISNYSHALLYVGGEHIIKAIDPEVVKVKLVDVMKGDLYTVVYRYPGLSEAQKNKIMTYARKKLVNNTIFQVLLVRVVLVEQQWECYQQWLT